MYSALCPDCGAAIYRAQGGSQLVTCARCQWSGQATFHFLPSGAAGATGHPQGHPGAGFLSSLNLPKFPAMPAMPPTMTPDPTDTPPDPLAVRREAARQALYRLTADVTDRLRATPDEWWEMNQWQRYNALQQAHSALYRALGGSRMGAYRPDTQAVTAALSEALLWMLLLLDGAEQPVAK